MYAILWALILVCLAGLHVLKEDNVMVWTEETLWELRQQITLNSLFVADYENSMGVDALDASEFFDSYVNYLEEQYEDKYCKTPTIEEIFAEDSSENLWNWFGCYETNPLPTT